MCCSAWWSSSSATKLTITNYCITAGTTHTIAITVTGFGLDLGAVIQRSSEPSHRRFRASFPSAENSFGIAVICSEDGLLNTLVVLSDYPRSALPSGASASNCWTRTSRTRPRAHHRPLDSRLLTDELLLEEVENAPASLDRAAHTPPRGNSSPPSSRGSGSRSGARDRPSADQG